MKQVFMSFSVDDLGDLPEYFKFVQWMLTSSLNSSESFIFATLIGFLVITSVKDCTNYKSSNKPNIRGV